ncbi:MAG: prepilin-type N-terminal cleavage/methylation domain-containing protein [Pirellulaceae bacterium]
MNQTICRYGKGFTLVELLVALALSAFLLGAIVLTYTSGNATSLDSAQLSRMQENVRFASDYLIRDIRNAGFRDETVLKFGHEQQVRDGYITIGNDGPGNSPSLSVRYAGRGHCTQTFEDLRILENQYFVDAGSRQLQCRGRFLADAEDAGTLLSNQAYSAPVGLISGVTGIAFQLVCPDGTTTCVCDLVDSPADSCIGVRIALRLQGLRDGAGGFDDRVVELSAAFRNVIIDRVYGN